MTDLNRSANPLVISAVRGTSGEQVILRFVRRSFLFCMLVFYSSTPCGFLAGFVTSFSGQFEEATSGGKIFNALAAISYVGSAIGILVVIARRPVAGLRFLVGAWPIWMVLIFVASSTAWSLHPDITAAKTAALLGTTLGGFCLGLCAERREQVWLLLSALTVVMLASLLMSVTLPSLAYDPGGGRMLRGIFVQKNSLGWSASITCVLALGTVFTKMRLRTLGAVACLSSLVAALASKSAAALVTVAIGCTLYIAISIVRQAGRYRYLALAFATPVIVSAVLLVNAFSDTWFSVLGKDQTFNGRAQIWEALRPAIAAHPYGGWGFNAFWPDPISGMYMKNGAFFASNAQGGYHEILINLGWVGLSVFVVSYLFILIRMLNYAFKGDRVAAMLASGLGALACLGWTAPVFLGTNLIYWVIIAFSGVYLSLNRYQFGS